MANAFYGDRWIVDTPGSSLLVTDYAYIKSITWTGDSVVGAGGAPHAVIQDKNNHVEWEAFAPAATFFLTQSVEKHWFDGFKVTTLDGGVLHIDYK